MQPPAQHWHSRQRKVSASTVRRDLGVLQSAIKHALQIQLLTRIVIIKRPAESPARERWLTRTEAATLAAAALGFQPVACDIENQLPMKWKRVSRPQYHLCPFILIGLYTGRRKEAILSLRWPKIDLARGKIDFRRATQSLLELVSVGDEVTAQCYEPDKYGRFACHVFKDGVNINLEQIKRGWGWLPTKKQWVRDPASEAAEAEAKSKKLGAWGLAGQVSPAEWRDVCWKQGKCDNAENKSP